MPDISSIFSSPIISTALTIIAVIICLKATKALIKLAAVIAAIIFLWPLINQMIQTIA